MPLPFLAQAGLALFGGLVNKATAPKPQYVVPDYKAIRADAEKAGFNPLTALTQGPQGSVVQSANYMGSAISDAALMLAENYAASSKAAKVSSLQSSNQKLRKAVENMTLRPKVGGIYSQQKSGGSNDTISNRVSPDRTGNGSVYTSSVGIRPLADQNLGRGSDPSVTVEPKAQSTYQIYSNDGGSTPISTGPDLDEMLSGQLIAANNRAISKAEFRRVNSKSMTFGIPLAVPWGITNRIDELMPPSSRPPLPDMATRLKMSGFGTWPAGMPYGIGF